MVVTTQLLFNTDTQPLYSYLTEDKITAPMITNKYTQRPKRGRWIAYATDLRLKPVRLPQPCPHSRIVLIWPQRHGLAIFSLDKPVHNSLISSKRQ